MKKDHGVAEAVEMWTLSGMVNNVYVSNHWKTKAEMNDIEPRTEIGVIQTGILFRNQDQNDIRSSPAVVEVERRS
jgi:hypothetical protein